MKQHQASFRAAGGILAFVNKIALGTIAQELLRLRDQAESAGAVGTAFMIVAAARQAERDAGIDGKADRALDEMLSREPSEAGSGYDLNGG